ncbi:oxidoreductase domain protein [Beutenbergia cavernae DSM 12333]|uniref:Oxidoreductase domain protein n=1 Tax=Beutenbergia cavernae (strain ATCC BAA-8 / DSM 12333 / CCUG 43141 / JCM 11478 / NBRC 16432 / NCIMB 13614 / HKI 0122) TaxID=471853 RepID=C5C1I1_BEUC1|nr:Gfo/Idh/MocA family oxidoreductase [Beutenbergia cavernae]ACQ81591.1 oxidoreductase domain protein [Beutenbergia cavernae DSM 12333]
MSEVSGDTVRVGILGLGSIGRTHAAALAHLAAGGVDVRVTAASGGTPEALRTSGWPDAAHVPAGELLGRELDVVVVATPSGQHAEHAVAALEAGADVVVEKPLATTTPDATRVLSVARERGRRVFPMAQRRLEAQHVAIRRLLDDGALGTLVLGEVLVPWVRDAAYYDAAPWRREMPAGGSLMNQGLHSVDLLSWFLGPLASVTAQTAVLGDGGPAEDTAVVTVRSAAGALGIVATSTATPPGDAARLTLRTDRGVIELAHTDVVRWEIDGVDRPSASSDVAAGSSDPAAIGIAGHVEAWRDVLEAHATGREARVRALDGWRTVALIDAAYRSAATGRLVDVPAAPDGA